MFIVLYFLLSSYIYTIVWSKVGGAELVSSRSFDYFSHSFERWDLRFQAAPVEFLGELEGQQIGAGCWSCVLATLVCVTFVGSSGYPAGLSGVSADCGSLRQSGPRPDPRLLRQAALEALTRSARTDSPRRVGRKRISGDNGRRRRRRTAGGGGGAWRGEEGRLLC
ncbi:hypothetical protein F511_24524 [Dorcoceras hygrometricum]|uniref:Uncharacterized protein n=1 Tax=Dorcoceras hygrometricum TaxID=472368 RepID=A0A2Z7AYX2_9LAMI|nr:hypothetical protein F511_24524 [Dorcoceras hygrometricum]